MLFCFVLFPPLMCDGYRLNVDIGHPCEWKEQEVGPIDSHVDCMCVHPDNESSSLAQKTSKTRRRVSKALSGSAVRKSRHERWR